MTAGLLWIEKVPVITGAPSGRSARVVKLTRPCRTCTICLLPLPLWLFWLEFFPGSSLRSESSLLLRRPKDKPAHWGISLWRPGWSVLHQTIPRWLSTRGSCRCLLLLFSTMGSNTVFLSNGQVDQLIVSVGLNKVQAFLELSSEATTKMITFLGISISMMARILAQVIESLCIL